MQSKKGEKLRNLDLKEIVQIEKKDGNFQVKLGLDGESRSIIETHGQQAEENYLLENFSVAIDVICLSPIFRDYSFQNMLAFKLRESN